MFKKASKILYIFMFVLIIIMILPACSTKNSQKEDKAQVQEVNLAVEYNTHAACAFVAQENGLLAQQGSFDVYATGVALAGALSKGDVDAAYICLVPAITAHANGGIPVKIVCGTHKYGYGLVVNTEKIKDVKDLEKEGIKIGCVREGATTDILLHKIIEANGLDKEKVMANVLRMNPAKQVLALRSNQLDAIVVPEHFASIADEDEGFEMLLKAQDVWPDMQGSVLVVTEDYFNNNPQEVKNLFKVTEEASQYINEHPKEAAEKVANRLNFFENSLDIDLKKMAQGGDDFVVQNSIIEKSMGNLEYGTFIDKDSVQEVIDYLYELGYIKEAFPAEDMMLDQSFLD